MKPSLGAHTFGYVWQQEAEPAFEAIAAAGFRHIQLMASPPHFDPWREDAARTRRLRAALERTGLGILALDIASSDINLASASTDVVAFAVDAYKRAIARAAELGAPWVCIGSGRRHALLSSANDRLMEAYRPAFAEIDAEARRQGVKLILENHPQGLLASASAMEGFLNAGGYDDIDVIYDVANAFTINEDPVAGLETLKHRTSIIHLSDSPKGQWRHDPIGTGEIDFAAIGRWVESTNYARHVVLEILSDDATAGLRQGVERLDKLGWAFRQ